MLCEFCFSERGTTLVPVGTGNRDMNLCASCLHDLRKAFAPDLMALISEYNLAQTMYAMALLDSSQDHFVSHTRRLREAKERLSEAQSALAMAGGPVLAAAKSHDE